MAAKVRMMTMREFRSTFANLDERVQVVRTKGNIEILGTWTPAPARLNGQAKEEAK